MATRDELAELYVKITADTAQMRAELDRLAGQVDQKLSEAERKANASAQRIEAAQKRLATMGTTMTVGVTIPLLAAGAGMTKLAMDAVEGENLFEVAMGGMSASSRAWSEQLRKDLGLDAYEVRRTQATFKMMFDSLQLGTDSAFAMSQGLTQLKYDLSSLYNLPAGRAQEMLQSGMAGEVEPLRRIGVDLSETAVKAWAVKKGLADVHDELSQGQKVLARYGLLLETTSKAQGDLARTLESPANQMRVMEQRTTNLGIKIGTKLLDSVGPAIRLMNASLDTASNAWDAMGDTGQNAILGVATMLGGAGPLMLGLAMAMRAVSALKANFASLGVVGKAGLAGLAASIIIPPAWEALNKHAAEMTYEEYTQQLMLNTEGGGLPMSREQFNASQQAAQPKAPAPIPEPDWAAEWKKQSSQSSQSVEERFQAAGIGAKEYTDALVAQDAASKAVGAETEAMRLRLVGLQDAQDGASASMEAAQEAYRQTQDRVQGLSDALAKAKQRLQDLSNPRLVGMGEFDDKIFAAEQSLKKLQLEQLQLGPVGSDKDPRYARSQALASAIEGQGRQAEILRLQSSLKYDPQLRAIDKAAQGPVKEITSAEAIKQIGETKTEITDLEKALADAKEEAAAHEERIRSLEKANQGYGDSMAEAQKQLQEQERRQTLVNDALAKAYTWYTQDRDKMRALGDEGVKQADRMDTAVNDLLAATRTQAQMERDTAVKFLDEVLKKYDELEKAGIIGLYQKLRTPEPIPTVGGSGRPVARAGGGPIDEPVLGVGLRSGRQWTFGEDDTEWVFNRAQMAAMAGGQGGGGGGQAFQITVAGDLVSISNISVRGDDDVPAVGKAAADAVIEALLAGAEMARGQGGHFPVALQART